MGMATFTVNSAADVVDGNFNQLSLREAVNRANATTAADTIVFANALEGQTLVLSQGQLVLTQDLTIDGDLDNDGTVVTIDGNHVDRLLTNQGSDDVALSLIDLALVNGRANGTDGGAIQFSGNDSSLKLLRCELANNATVGYDSGAGGGAIATSAGIFEIVDSRIHHNESADSAGAILITGGTVSIRTSEINDNTAHSGNGGAIYHLIRAMFSTVISKHSGTNLRTHLRFGRICAERFSSSAEHA